MSLSIISIRRQEKHLSEEMERIGKRRSPFLQLGSRRAKEEWPQEAQINSHSQTGYVDSD